MIVKEYDVFKLRNYVLDNVVKKIFDGGAVAGTERREVFIVAIAQGGIPVAQEVAAILEERGLVVHQGRVTAQRPSTKEKNNPYLKPLINCFFKLSPVWVNDRLRILEHTLLMRKGQQDSRGRVVVPKDINVDKLSASSCVLVVDDAVDSGASLRSVLDYLKEVLPPSKEVMTLAYVKTNVISPIDVNFLVEENVLIRFPWSLDAK